MAHIVLVHGAWHGGWCWYKVVPELEALGHTVAAIDLPGHGSDTTPTASVDLQKYVDRVGEVLGKSSESAFLVGHSMGGIVITEAAEQHHGNVAGLIYLAAFLSEPGQALGGLNKDSELLPAISVGVDGVSMTVIPDRLEAVFYHDCPRADIALARANIVPQKIGISPEPCDTPPTHWQNIPRSYITCLDDRALPLSQQRQMISDTGCDTVKDMPTSHSPFFSAPKELASHVHELVLGVGP